MTMSNMTVAVPQSSYSPAVNGNAVHAVGIPHIHTYLNKRNYKQQKPEDGTDGPSNAGHSKVVIVERIICNQLIHTPQACVQVERICIIPCEEFLSNSRSRKSMITECFGCRGLLQLLDCKSHGRSTS